MTGFSFQYFCNCVAILHESFLGGLFGFFFKNPFYQSRVRLSGQTYPFVEDGWSLSDSGRRLKSGRKPTTDCRIWLLPPAVPVRWDLCLQAGGCRLECTGWAPDAGETLESLCKVVGKDRGCKLDWPQLLGVDSRSWGFGTWKKPPRSAVKAVHLHSCSVEVWACRRGNGLCESGAYWFFSSQLSTIISCFPSFWELGKLVTRSWTTDGSWATAWRESGWRERERSEKGWVKTGKEI